MAFQLKSRLLNWLIEHPSGCTVGKTCLDLQMGVHCLFQVLSKVLLLFFIIQCASIAPCDKGGVISKEEVLDFQLCLLEPVVVGDLSRVVESVQPVILKEALSEPHCQDSCFAEHSLD
eukprot:Phypoly_transcript_03448.p1 GENE.Phypoly_transcript_03448~~Phypoly_transcript_03448.p1  ORF type:complete len:118 (-),score=5.73 Phypoly_transcript_03448:711-1064(-)